MSSKYTSPTAVSTGLMSGAQRVRIPHDKDHTAASQNLGLHGIRARQITSKAPAHSRPFVGDIAPKQTCTIEIQSTTMDILSTPQRTKSSPTSTAIQFSNIRHNETPNFPTPSSYDKVVKHISSTPILQAVPLRALSTPPRSAAAVTTDTKDSALAASGPRAATTPVTKARAQSAQRRQPAARFEPESSPPRSLVARASPMRPQKAAANGVPQPHQQEHNHAASRPTHKDKEAGVAPSTPQLSRNMHDTPTTTAVSAKPRSHNKSSAVTSTPPFSSSSVTAMTLSANKAAKLAMQKKKAKFADHMQHQQQQQQQLSGQASQRQNHRLLQQQQAMSHLASPMQHTNMTTTPSKKNSSNSTPVTTPVTVTASGAGTPSASPAMKAGSSQSSASPARARHTHLTSSSASPATTAGVPRYDLATSSSALKQVPRSPRAAADARLTSNNKNSETPLQDRMTSLEYNNNNSRGPKDTHVSAMVSKTRQTTDNFTTSHSMQQDSDFISQPHDDITAPMAMTGLSKLLACSADRPITLSVSPPPPPPPMPMLHNPRHASGGDCGNNNHYEPYLDPQPSSTTKAKLRANEQAYGVDNENDNVMSRQLHQQYRQNMHHYPSQSILGSSIVSNIFPMSPPVILTRDQGWVHEDDHDNEFKNLAACSSDRDEAAVGCNRMVDANNSISPVMKRSGGGLYAAHSYDTDCDCSYNTMNSDCSINMSMSTINSALNGPNNSSVTERPSSARFKTVLGRHGASTSSLINKLMISCEQDEYQQQLHLLSQSAITPSSGLGVSSADWRDSQDCEDCEQLHGQESLESERGQPVGHTPAVAAAAVVVDDDAVKASGYQMLRPPVLVQGLDNSDSMNQSISCSQADMTMSDVLSPVDDSNCSVHDISPRSNISWTTNATQMSELNKAMILSPSERATLGLGGALSSSSAASSVQSQGRLSASQSRSQLFSSSMTMMINNQTGSFDYLDDDTDNHSNSNNFHHHHHRDTLDTGDNDNNYGDMTPIAYSTSSPSALAVPASVTTPHAFTRTVRYSADYFNTRLNSAGGSISSPCGQTSDETKTEILPPNMWSPVSSRQDHLAPQHLSPSRRAGNNDEEEVEEEEEEEEGEGLSVLDRAMIADSCLVTPTTARSNNFHFDYDVHSVDEGEEEESHNDDSDEGEDSGFEDNHDMPRHGVVVDDDDSVDLSAAGADDGDDDEATGELNSHDHSQLEEISFAASVSVLNSSCCSRLSHISSATHSTSTTNNNNNLNHNSVSNAYHHSNSQNPHHLAISGDFLGFSMDNMSDCGGASGGISASSLLSYDNFDLAATCDGAMMMSCGSAIPHCFGQSGHLTEFEDVVNTDAV